MFVPNIKKEALIKPVVIIQQPQVIVLQPKKDKI